MREELGAGMHQGGMGLQSGRDSKVALIELARGLGASVFYL